MFHHYARYPHVWHLARRPSRLVWFAVGAFAATLFHKARDDHRGHRYLYHNVNGSAPPFSGGQDHLVSSAAPDVAPSHSQYPSDHQSKWPSWSVPNPMDDRSWEDHRSRVTQFRQQARETVSELSESTLDGLISTVEALKAKLADYRAAEHNAHLKRLEADSERRIDEQQGPRHMV